VIVGNGNCERPWHGFAIGEQDCCLNNAQSFRKPIEGNFEGRLNQLFPRGAEGASERCSSSALTLFPLWINQDSQREAH
jgi:hypothetical protein